MARYRKIDPRMWTDEKFLMLSQDAQFLFFYLITGPHTTNLPGLSSVGEAAMAERLGPYWTTKILRKCLDELRALRMADHDQMAQVLWVPNVIRYDPPNSIMTVKSWATPWGEARACDLKVKAYQTLKAYVLGLHPALAEAFTLACPATRETTIVPPVEPDAETEAASQVRAKPSVTAKPEPSVTAKPEPSVTAKPEPSDDERLILEHLNRITGRADLPPNAQFRAASKELRDRIAEGATVEDCCAVLDWLRAVRDADWVAGNLDTLTPFRPGTWLRNTTQATAWKLGARPARAAATASPEEAARYDRITETGE